MDSDVDVDASVNQGWLAICVMHVGVFRCNDIRTVNQTPPTTPSNGLSYESGLGGSLVQFVADMVGRRSSGPGWKNTSGD